MAQDPSPTPSPRSRFPAWGLVLVVVLALAFAVVLAIQGFSGSGGTNAPPSNVNAKNNNATPPATTYSNSTLGIEVTLPSGWETTSTTTFSADVVFRSSAMAGCGCAVYIIREANPQGLSVTDWLSSPLAKRDKYMTQAAFDARRTSGTPSASALAGTYSETRDELGGIPALIQTYETEGGGYTRYLVARGQSIYALTLWSDAYYFSDSVKSTRYDRGTLRTQADSLVTSFKFL